MTEIGSKLMCWWGAYDMPDCGLSADRAPVLPAVRARLRFVEDVGDSEQQCRRGAHRHVRVAGPPDRAPAAPFAEAGRRRLEARGPATQPLQNAELRLGPIDGVGPELGRDRPARSAWSGRAGSPT